MNEFDPLHLNRSPQPSSPQEVRRKAVKEFHHIENPDYENVLDLDPLSTSNRNFQTVQAINDLRLNNNSPCKVPLVTFTDHETERVPLRPHRPPPPPPIQMKKRADSYNCLLERDDDHFIHKSSSLSKVRDSPRNSSFYIKERNDPSPPLPITREPYSLNNRTSSFYGAMADVQSSETTVYKMFGQREQEMPLCMAKRQEEYIIRQKFKIFVGTWNVNGQLAPKDVREWVYFDKDPPDIYFLGFQELDLSKEAYFTESSREEDWINAVTISLPHRSSKYMLLKKIRLVGILLLVFVKTIHFPDIKDVSCHHVPTGILGFMGNKGGVGVRLEIHSTTICAVNSHLAAHMEETQRRNQDFSDIYYKMHFQVYGQSPVSIHHHDIVFWLGDLNYRIEDMSPEYVKELVDRKEYKLLKEKDQLMIQKREGNVFKGYFEGEINFRPTYKYDPTTDDWDTSEKGRMPAWCDRILWWEQALTQRNPARVKPRSSVTLLKYDSHMTLKISDHKPVSALFAVDVKVIDDEKYKKVFEEENRRLDRLENEYLPTMSLDKHDIDFGEVQFQQTKQATLELVNTGQIPCGFEFICRPGEDKPCKEWLTISKLKGIMLKDEKLVIEFEIYVNRLTAPSLNSGEGKLEDILILHLSGGKDFFITVIGKYLPSCFGMSIEALCRLRHPVRQVDVKEIQNLCKIEPNRASDLKGQETSSMLQIPKELWALVDHIYQNAKLQEDLFQHPGLHSEFERIRECLDTKIDTSTERVKLPGSNHSAAEALLIFLEALPVPVIPFHLYGPCLEVADNFLLSKQVLQGLSKRHRNVFKYTMSFLRELLKYKDANGLDVQLLGPIFSGLILRPEPKHRKNRIEARLDRDKATKFVINFLQNEYDE